MLPVLMLRVLGNEKPSHGIPLGLNSEAIEFAL